MTLMGFSASQSFEHAFPHYSSRVNTLFWLFFNHIPCVRSDIMLSCTVWAQAFTPCCCFWSDAYMIVCIFRSDDCSIRVVIPTVSDQQCMIKVTENGSVEVVNLSSTSPTRVNSKPLSNSAVLNHKDLISIVDRHFRFEYPDGHPMASQGRATLNVTFLMLVNGIFSIK